MANLTDFLLDLAADPDRCARFKVDPNSELVHAALTERDKIALASRDPDKISEAMAEGDRDAGMILEWLFSLSRGSTTR